MPTIFERLKFGLGETKKSTPKQTSALDEKSIKKLLVKFMGFTESYGQSRAEFLVPEYDLEEIERAADADSYIKMSLMKYSYLIYKAGYKLKSDNDSAVEYLKIRFRLMSIATKTPTNILFQEIADDIVKFSNAFIIKARGDLAYSGIKAKGIFGTKPVLGYFRVDPTTIKIKRDKHGTISQYVQVGADGEEKAFAPNDVIHMYLDRKAGNAYGTPRISAALEDVKLLRRIEGNVIALIYRFAIPIFHFKVGIPQAGQQASETEIRDLQREIENMSMDGMIFTNERTEVKAVGAEGNALDTSGPLNYFEKRVFSALGVSEAQMGRGGAKQDADSMEAQIHDTVKHIQRTMAAFIENDIITELLLEGGFDPVKNESDIVKYRFNEISLDTKIKVENHEVYKYQSNLQTIDEARTNMGMVTDFDEDRLYAHLIDETVALKQKEVDHDNQVDILKMSQAHAEKLADKAAAQNASTTDAKQIASQKNNGNGTNAKASDQNKQGENLNRPENQHGKTSVKIKESFLDKDKSKKQKELNHKKNYDNIYKTYNNLRNDIIDDASEKEVLFAVAYETMTRQIKEAIELAASEGVSRFVEEAQDAGINGVETGFSLVISTFVEEAAADLKQLLKDIKQKANKQNAETVFSTLEYRLRFMLEYYPRKTLWFSYIKAANANKIKELKVNFSSEKDKEQYPEVVNTTYFKVEDIPAFHAFCNCELSIR